MMFINKGNTEYRVIEQRPPSVLARPKRGLGALLSKRLGHHFANDLYTRDEIVGPVPRGLTRTKAERRDNVATNRQRNDQLRTNADTAEVFDRGGRLRRNLLV